MGATCYNYLTISGNPDHVNDLIDMIYKADPKFLENFPFFISLDNNHRAWYGLYTLLEELPDEGNIELTYTTFETIEEYLKIYYRDEVMIPENLSYKDFRDQYVLNIDSNNWYTDNAGIHYDALIETQILDRIASNDLLLLINHKWYTPELQARYETLLKGAAK